jgi:hypothetical protein
MALVAESPNELRLSRQSQSGHTEVAGLPELNPGPHPPSLPRKRRVSCGGCDATAPIEWRPEPRRTRWPVRSVRGCSIPLMPATRPPGATPVCARRVGVRRRPGPDRAGSRWAWRIERSVRSPTIIPLGLSRADLRPWVRPFECWLLARGVDRVDIAGANSGDPGAPLEGIGERARGLASTCPRNQPRRPTGPARSAVRSSHATPWSSRAQPLSATLAAWWR